MFIDFDMLITFFQDNINYLTCLLINSDHLLSPFFTFWFDIITSLFLIVESFFKVNFAHFFLLSEYVWLFFILLNIPFLHSDWDHFDYDYETTIFEDYEYLHILHPDEDFETLEDEEREEAAALFFEDELNFWLKEELIYSDWLTFDHLECHEFDFWDDENFTILEPEYMAFFFGEDWVNYQKRIALENDIGLRELVLPSDMSREDYLKFYDQKI